MILSVVKRRFSKNLIGVGNPSFSVSPSGSLFVENVEFLVHGPELCLGSFDVTVFFGLEYDLQRKAKMSNHFRESGRSCVGFLLRLVFFLVQDFNPAQELSTYLSLK